MKALYVIAWICLVLSVAVHIVSILGPEDVFFDIDAFVWPLHGAAILLGFPAFLCAKRATEGTRRKEFPGAVFEYCPLWMKRMVGLFVVYGIVNFILFMKGAHASNGHNTPASVFRGFSGAWMIAYSIEVAVFCSYLKKRRILSNSQPSEQAWLVDGDWRQQGDFQRPLLKLKPGQFRRLTILFLIVGCVFAALLWLAVKGYPWYLGITLFSLFPFAVIQWLGMLYCMLRSALYLRSRYNELWKQNWSGSFAEKMEAQRLIAELDDPYLKSMQSRLTKFSTVCFWIWLVFIVIVLTVLAVVDWLYW